jgi:hypothetical protein
VVRALKGTFGFIDSLARRDDVFFALSSVAGSEDAVQSASVSTLVVCWCYV